MCFKRTHAFWLDIDVLQILANKAHETSQCKICKCVHFFFNLHWIYIHQALWLIKEWHVKVARE